MRNTSLTLAWATWRQHRVALVGACVFFLLAGIVSANVSAYHFGAQLREWPILEFFAVAIAVAMCVLSVFSYGDFRADVMACASCFPSSYFRLPVRTGALLLWPIAYGAVLPVTLWIVLANFIIRPWQHDTIRFWSPIEEDIIRESAAIVLVPLWWPAALGAACVAWLQFIVWSPFGLRGLRVVLLVAVVGALIELAVIFAREDVSEMARAFAYVGLMFVAWPLSFLGVRHARRGGIPNWEGIYAPLARLLGRREQVGRALVSAARAHEWFLWKMWGRWLPILTISMIAVGLAPIFFHPVLIGMLPAMLYVPVLVAGFAGAWGGGKSMWSADRSGLSHLIATMPISDAALVRGVFKVATRTTFVIWMVSLLLVTLLPWAIVMMKDLIANPTEKSLIRRLAFEWQQDLQKLQSEPIPFLAKRIGLAIILIVWTWKRAVNSYVLALMGRGWLVREAGIWACGIVVLLSLSSALTAMGLQLGPNGIWPWAFGVLILCRMIAAVCVLHLIWRKGLVKARTIAYCLAVWIALITITITIGLVFWMSQRMSIVPIVEYVFLVFFAFPMVRLAAAPLVLERVRHR